MKQDKIEFIKREDLDVSGSIPFAPINFDEYHSNNIDVWDEYTEMGSEYQQVQRAIMKANFPYLIESEKGQGKTLLIHTICKENGIALIEEPVGVGTKKSDLLGSKEINRDGTLFNLGLLPRAIEVANHYGHACLFCDDASAQEHDIQRWWNRICDGRKSIVANGKQFKLKNDAKLSIVWAINPATYAGINTLTEDLRSRFIGRAWNYPTPTEFEKVIDWDGISHDLVKEPLLTLVQDVYALRVKGDVDYALSVRDVAQFCDQFRYNIEDEVESPLETTLKEVIMIKFSDASERELVKVRINDTFGVSL